MNPTLLEIIQTHGNGTESTCYCELTSSSVPTGKAELKEGFSFFSSQTEQPNWQMNIRLTNFNLHI